MAPGAMAELPAPTHAFIGGSSGNLGEIIECLLSKNPKVRIVVNTIALESVGEVAEMLNRFGFDDQEVVQMQLSRSRKAGRYIGSPSLDADKDEVVGRRMLFHYLIRQTF